MLAAADLTELYLLLIPADHFEVFKLFVTFVASRLLRVYFEPLLAALSQLRNELRADCEVRVRVGEDFEEELDLAVLSDALQQLHVQVVALDLHHAISLDLPLVVDPARLILDDLLQHELDEEDDVQGQEGDEVHR